MPKRNALRELLITSSGVLLAWCSFSVFGLGTFTNPALDSNVSACEYASPIKAASAWPQSVFNFKESASEKSFKLNCVTLAMLPMALMDPP